MGSIKKLKAKRVRLKRIRRELMDKISSQRGYCFAMGLEHTKKGEALRLEALGSLHSVQKELDQYKEEISLRKKRRELRNVEKAFGAKKQ